MWSRPTLVTTATTPSATLVASQRPPRPTSMTGDVDRAVGEPAEGGRRSGSRTRSGGRRRRAAARGRRCSDSSSASSASPMGSPLAVSRSLIRSRCGLVKVPTVRPLAISRVVRARAVEVLPLVPVRWRTGAARLRIAQDVHRAGASGPGRARPGGCRPACARGSGGGRARPGRRRAPCSGLTSGRRGPTLGPGGAMPARLRPRSDDADGRQVSSPAVDVARSPAAPGT